MRQLRKAATGDKRRRPHVEWLEDRSVPSVLPMAPVHAAALATEDEPASLPPTTAAPAPAAPTAPAVTAQPMPTLTAAQSTPIALADNDVAPRPTSAPRPNPAPTPTPAPTPSPAPDATPTDPTGPVESDTDTRPIPPKNNADPAPINPRRIEPAPPEADETTQPRTTAKTETRDDAGSALAALPPRSETDEAAARQDAPLRHAGVAIAEAVALVARPQSAANDGGTPAAEADSRAPIDADLAAIAAMTSAPNMSSLEAALASFLDGLDDLGQQLMQAPSTLGWPAWVVAAALAGGACEVGRRQVSRRANTATTDPLRWTLGLPDA